MAPAKVKTPLKETVLPRLKKRTEFLRVARHGKKCATPGLILQSWTPTVHRDSDRNEKVCLAHSARIGYTVSRKVGNAVYRNKVKRRLRAAASVVIPSHALAGTDLVIIGRPAALVRPFGRLVQDLETALKKLDCYRD